MPKFIDVAPSREHPQRMAEAYEAHFRTRLDYLRNREEFIGIFDYNTYKAGFYNEALRYIDEHRVKTYGVLVFGRVSEFLESIDEIPYDALHINEVLPIKPYVYY